MYLCIEETNSVLSQSMAISIVSTFVCTTNDIPIECLYTPNGDMVKKNRRETSKMTHWNTFARKIWLLRNEMSSGCCCCVERSPGLYINVCCLLLNWALLLLLTEFNKPLIIQSKSIFTRLCFVVDFVQSLFLISNWMGYFFSFASCFCLFCFCVSLGYFCLILLNRFLVFRYINPHTHRLNSAQQIYSVH